MLQNLEKWPFSYFNFIIKIKLSFTLEKREEKSRILSEIILRDEPSINSAVVQVTKRPIINAENIFQIM